MPFSSGIATSITDDVRAELLDEIDRGPAVARFADDLDLLVRLEDAPQALPDHGVIVNQEDANLLHREFLPSLASAGRDASSRSSAWRGLRDAAAPRSPSSWPPAGDWPRAARAPACARARRPRLRAAARAAFTRRSSARIVAAALVAALVFARLVVGRLLGIVNTTLGSPRGRVFHRLCTQSHCSGCRRTMPSNTSESSCVMRDHVGFEVTTTLYVHDGQDMNSDGEPTGPSRTMKTGTTGAPDRSASRAMPEFVLAGFPKKSTKTPRPASRVLVERQHEQLAVVEALSARRRPRGACAPGGCRHARAEPFSQRSMSGFAIDSVHHRDGEPAHAVREHQAAPSCRSDRQDEPAACRAARPDVLAHHAFVLERRPCGGGRRPSAAAGAPSSAPIRPRLAMDVRRIRRRSASGRSGERDREVREPTRRRPGAHA
jgi:hypothetical protein